MRCLLDSHALLWSIGESRQLSARARGVLQDPVNEIFVSAVSLWEVSLKYRLGKLVLASMTPSDIPRSCRRLGFEIIPLAAAEASTFHTLPRVVRHKDPFDRLLIHQCISLKMILVSRDPCLPDYREYGLKYLW